MRFDLYFQLQVQQFTQQDAIFFQNGEKITRLSYEAVDHQSSCLANYLTSIGVVEGSSIGVFCHRGLLYPLLFLACAKIGAIYVPLPIRAEKIKLNTIVHNADIDFIFTEDDLLPEAKQLRCSHTYSLTQIDFSLHEKCIFTEPKSINPILYLIYSSGTTNTPKGIAIEHEGLTFWSDILKSIIHHELPPRVLGNTSVGFDPHIWEYVMAWCSGGCLYFTDEATRSETNRLQQYMLMHGISDATFTPKLFNKFINQQSVLKQLQQTGFMRAYLTGEALTKNILRECDAANIKVYNCYGPSELTFGFSIKEVHEANAGDHDGVEIGFSPGLNVEAFVRQLPASDDDDRMSGNITRLSDATQAVGELLISSPYMTPGYYHNNTMTLSRFFSIFTENKNYRVYPTEDIVKVDNQKLFYKGRLGDRVKRNMIFINLEEIRQVLDKAIPDKRILYDVVMLPTEKRDYLYLFFSRLDHEVDFKKIISQHLSMNEVPDFVLHLEEFPCTDNGKSDKLRLKALAENHLQQINNERRDSCLYAK